MGGRQENMVQKAPDRATKKVVQDKIDTLLTKKTKWIFRKVGKKCRVGSQKQKI